MLICVLTEKNLEEETSNILELVFFLKSVLGNWRRLTKDILDQKLTLEDQILNSTNYQEEKFQNFKNTFSPHSNPKVREIKDDFMKDA